MPNWSEILDEVNSLIAEGHGGAIDLTRRKYLKNLSDTLQIQPKQYERPQKLHGTSASFEKCGITVHIPTTATNSTALAVKTADSDKNRKFTAGF